MQNLVLMSRMVFELFEVFSTYLLSLFHSFTRTDSPTGIVSHRGAPLLKMVTLKLIKVCTLNTFLLRMDTMYNENLNKYLELYNCIYQIKYIYFLK